MKLFGREFFRKPEPEKFEVQKVIVGNEAMKAMPKNMQEELNFFAIHPPTKDGRVCICTDYNGNGPTCYIQEKDLLYMDKDAVTDFEKGLDDLKTEEYTYQY